MNNITRAKLLPGMSSLTMVYLLLDAAAALALNKAAAGRAAFRSALRDALERTVNLPVTFGVITMRKQDHTGLDECARVLTSIESNTWKLVK